jgi:hypothetical protein
MAIDIIQLPADGTGKRLYAITQTLSGNTVYHEGHAIVDGAGKVIGSGGVFPVVVGSGVEVIHRPENLSGVEIIHRPDNLSGIAVITGSGAGVQPHVPTAGRIRALLNVTDASGGVLLNSGDVKSVLVVALSRNSGDLFVGFSNERPYSGYGILLQAGQSLPIDIDNMNKLAVVANESGDMISYGGVA